MLVGLAIAGAVLAGLYLGYVIYARGIDAGARLAGRTGSVTREEDRLKTQVIPFEQEDSA